jgi:NUMOD4 motif/HNH endonuclease
MKEEWRTIDTHPEYLVSSRGRVKRDDHILRPGRDTQGYLQVSLCRLGVPKQIRVHRLVAEAFIPNPHNKPQVNHRNPPKQNNCVDNLEWATNSENEAHAIVNGLINTKGTRNGMSVLSPEKVKEIRSKAGKITQRALAKQYGVVQQTISRVVRHELWGHVEVA